MLPEEEAWDSEAGANQSAQEEFIWERVWIIGSGIPSPTAGKAFRGVEEEHPPLPRVPPPPELRTNVLRVLHSASSSLG